jgi:hypothetical protein
VPNAGFTLAEDAAIKNRLANLRVSDDRDADRKVQVFFRYPDGETERHYPFITIELIDIVYASDRQHSEADYYFTRDAALSAAQQTKGTGIDYFPSEYDEEDLSNMAGEDGYIRMDQFVPVDLIYQISTYCRSQRHDRELSAHMLRYVFPFRRGYIHVPEDDTMRRLSVLDWRTADLLDQEAGYKKRVFRKVMTASVNAEIPQSNIYEVQKVLNVSGTLTDRQLDSDVPTNPISEDF